VAGKTGLEARIENDDVRSLDLTIPHLSPRLFDVTRPLYRGLDWMRIFAKRENCARGKLASPPSRIFAVTRFDFPSHLLPSGLCASHLACNLV
jgi:hypothetical protein